MDEAKSHFPKHIELNWVDILLWGQHRPRTWNTLEAYSRRTFIKLPGSWFEQMFWVLQLCLCRRSLAFDTHIFPLHMKLCFHLNYALSSKCNLKAHLSKHETVGGNFILFSDKSIEVLFINGKAGCKRGSFFHRSRLVRSCANVIPFFCTTSLQSALLKASLHQPFITSL